MFLDRDTRCLKPESDPDPNSWEHYDPDEFYNALSQVNRPAINQVLRVAVLFFQAELDKGW